MLGKQKSGVLGICMLDLTWDISNDTGIRRVKRIRSQFSWNHDVDVQLFGFYCVLEDFSPVNEVGGKFQCDFVCRMCTHILAFENKS